MEFGCFRIPAQCTGSDCKLLITYRNTTTMNKYVDITMETTGKWVALGHNSVGKMVRKF